ncbi:bifunctional [glutamate--ammonia ligase]-adenylyl-L-tyrosine phosphorylase/[glutamate--ammonia-ligase] adenylyltransferase [Pseudoalteromonas sp. Of7M-16]|uniref:bifunctional [glutamate--ammonia ligase]-adenylyl-L-tyrosine phosphorylase/[glutamate--ammonia-ligase] adenylyltransferase n=1 Tax=Pseudoalteromonas sp. Of7M-16 TaxID=2917756 RepID=UPI001EF4E214|nr:bifunctional [glutamate--ammonia ligase]-adenylyl-L-tyrosine phosphorylase/[glutamate--ammonia-ligase] adenylyltransferase [Pseudoalteromonas sp. Of7M-16]MCG7549412.1 bifunctional [glutamate--ammonia ligase]-adenylyl-L-tyrosine phosphorylase/[glutamate--ammonia-ligase] adenylyltransferase [Pseudoalteromonas sp. Of7M-16]
MEQGQLSPELSALAEQRFAELFPGQTKNAQALRLLALSDFAYRILAQHPQWLHWLLDEQAMALRDIEPVLTGDIEALSDAQCFAKLRLYRKRYWLKLMWLDLVEGNDIADSVAYQSKLSEQLIDSANKWAFAQVAKSNGAPVNGSLEPLPMLVLGMGKLGGQELNFSSDIDLIFTYPLSVKTSGGRRSIDAQVFYTKVAQKLIAALDQRTADGQVFRVDMRLRPFGESGPLVMSFSAMEDYYQDQGREWERYAMLKARLLGQKNQYWDEFKALIRPFVFRRYIDFSVIESLRKMKHMIAQEVRRKGLKNNIKLGAGGIREVEFIVQALQMIRGGREPDLQTPSLLNALCVLASQEVIPASAAAALQTQYLYLRRVEQYLQAFNDEQTQTLPEDRLNQLRLQTLFGFSEYDELVSHIEQVQREIRYEFSQVIGEEAHDTQSLKACFISAWEYQDISYLDMTLSEELQSRWQETLTAFYADITKKQIGVRGRDVLDKLMPLVLSEVTPLKAPEVLQRVFDIIAKVASRTAYLELLYENLGALKQLIKLCSHSVWIAQQIARYPILLDELIDPAVLYRPLPLNAYYNEIQQYFLRIDPEDLELQMEALRQFKQTQQLRIAAADATGVLDIMKVSDHLTALAESIVAKAVDIAWGQMISRYGAPQGTSNEAKGFAVIAYGKAGGFELGYDSDLDLVFVHNSDGQSKTVGERSISSRQFYLKLAQRLMHLFNTRTLSGILYELDTRLRPEGNSGLLAINIESYYQYLQQQAWTWEHQALVRARMIVGEEVLVKRFHTIRHDILCQKRSTNELKDDIVKMREKMRQHLSKDSTSEFDLKQGAGGMTDIEFLAQYLVLACAFDYPALTRYSDNIRIFELASKESVISTQSQSTLTQAYCQLREHYHLNSLNGKGKTVNAKLLAEQSDDVREIWQAYFE